MTSIIVMVSGGRVVDIKTDNTDIELDVLDMDNYGAETDPDMLEYYREMEEDYHLLPFHLPV